MVVKAFLFGGAGCLVSIGATQLQTSSKANRWDRIDGMKNKFSNSPGPEIEKTLNGKLIMTFPEIQTKSE